MSVAAACRFQDDSEARVGPVHVRSSVGDHGSQRCRQVIADEHPRWIQVTVTELSVSARGRETWTAVTVTVTGTAGVKESLLGLDSWIAAAEEVSLQTASEGGKRRCRRDVLRQTVPNTGCSDWKGPVADS